MVVVQNFSNLVSELADRHINRST